MATQPDNSSSTNQSQQSTLLTSSAQAKINEVLNSSSPAPQPSQSRTTSVPNTLSIGNPHLQSIYLALPLSHFQAQHSLHEEPRHFSRHHHHHNPFAHQPSLFPAIPYSVSSHYNLRVKNDPERTYFSVLKDHEWAMHGMSGAGAGTITALITQPLDVTKTVIQIQKQNHLGTFGTLRNIFFTDGVRGCYRGLGTTTMALVPQWGVYFCMYSHFNYLGYNYLGFRDGPSAHVLSATTASLITDVAVSPLWMVKTRLQTQCTTGVRKYLNTSHAFKTIVQQEGPRALYQGLTAQILGVSQYAIQFPLYEKLKYWLASRGGKNKTQLTPGELIIASSISKFSACLAAYPHEVLRTRFQHQNRSDPNAYKTLGEAIKRIFREEGFKGFYRGLGTTLLRVTPSAALTFTSYELILRALQRKSGMEELD